MAYFAVTIVLSTFNRSGQLGRAIACLLNQKDAPPYEVVVVDNNSSDETKHVVETFVQSGAAVKYVFEPHQGLSHARNAGIQAASADIVAFTDDDVRISETWVAAVHRALEQHPEVDCVGGRTLPLWPSTPPRWLTRLHWVGPLALQDYGDEPFILDSSRPLCLAGANFAFRKRVFDDIGPFSPDYPRSEDTEFVLRLWLTGRRALYVPEMVVHAAVQPERLTKRYHRRWHANIGRCNARMGFEELGDPRLGLRSAPPRVFRVFGLPVFAMRLLGIEVRRWLCESAAGRTDTAFRHEVRARSLVNYIRESASLHRRKSGPVANPVLEAARGATEADAAQVPARFET